MKQVVTPSSSREPGTVQYGVLHSPSDFLFSTPFAVPVGARSDGRVVCATCSGIIAFDARLHETGRVDILDFASLTDLAVAPDDTVYAYVPGAILRMADLDHLSADSVPQWPAPAGPNFDLIVAGTEGPYTGVTAASAPGVPIDFAVRGFDAMTGQPRTVASGQYLLAAARGGGVFTVEQQEKQSATLRRLDASGTVVWSRTISATLDGLAIHGAAAAADGGVSVHGWSVTAVDFGDHQLASPGWFVAGFDPAGATRFAFTVPGIITHIAQAADGSLLIASQDTVAQSGRPVNSTLSVATPAGILRTLLFGGPGGQTIDGLAAAPDGAAWVYISNFKNDDFAPDPVLQIGDSTFAEPGEYLFKIVP